MVTVLRVIGLWAALLAVSASAQNCNSSSVYNGQNCVVCNANFCPCASFNSNFYCSLTNTFDVCAWSSVAGACMSMYQVPCSTFTTLSTCGLPGTCGWFQSSSTSGACISGSSSTSSRSNVAAGSCALALSILLSLSTLLFRCSKSWKNGSHSFILGVLSFGLLIVVLGFAALINNQQVRVQCPTPANASTLLLTLQGQTEVTGSFPTFYVDHYLKDTATQSSISIVLFGTAALVPVSLMAIMSGSWKGGSAGLGLWAMSTFVAATFALSFVVSSLDQDQRLTAYCNPGATVTMAPAGILIAVIFAMMTVVAVPALWVMKNFASDDYYRLKWATSLLTLCGRSDLCAALKEEQHAAPWSVPLIPTTSLGGFNNSNATNKNNNSGSSSSAIAQATPTFSSVSTQAWDTFLRRLAGRNEVFERVSHLEGQARTAFLEQLGLSNADGYQVEIQWNQRRVASGGSPAGGAQGVVYGGCS